MNEPARTATADPAAPYEGASEMRHANAQLLQALDNRLGTDSRAESEVAALTAMRPEIQLFLQRGAATGQFLEDTQERTACQVLLDYWSSSLAHAEMDPGRPRLAVFRPEALPDLKDKRCPFVGLASIREPQLLFGREQAAQSLLERLQQVPLVVVLGGSGSGKSSLVLAGAMPALQAPGREPRFRAVGPFTPGNAVLEQLLRAVVRARAAQAA
ncbi:MAG: nSTAND1 domain-containing NTPase, partial [Burkholderiaceae bacterium]